MVTGTAILDHEKGRRGEKLRGSAGQKLAWGVIWMAAVVLLRHDRLHVSIIHYSRVQFCINFIDLNSLLFLDSKRKTSLCMKECHVMWVNPISVSQVFDARSVRFLLQLSLISPILWWLRGYPKVSGLAAWSENCKWYSSLPLGAVVSLFCESV
jgi:hypothetical protein